MDWITRMQNAIDYIEAHLTDTIDYEVVAEQSFSSSYHFQRIFGILCGCTLGEYIRNRRLTLAGAELASSKEKVIDIALKYGYESPDSFAKAFQKFHGITPSEARRDGSCLKSFSRVSMKITLEGGSMMNYRIEEKPEMVIAGCKMRMAGVPSDRYQQEHDFMVQGETRFVRYALQGMAGNCDVEYGVVSNLDEDGYDFTIGTIIPQYFVEHLKKTVGAENIRRISIEKVPSQRYLVVETERGYDAIQTHLELRSRAVAEWLRTGDYLIRNAPEITVFHHPAQDKAATFVELWLPIEKK